MAIDVEGSHLLIKPKVHVCLDVSALRHCEHLAASGWCTCTRDFALRTVPTKPSQSDFDAFLRKCHSPTCKERYILSHHPLPGETLPRPCTACG